MYHCTNCGAERWEEKRSNVDGIVLLKIIYECDSYMELMRVGAVWKHIDSVYKCKPLAMKVS
jgi:hypothetical protein